MIELLPFDQAISNADCYSKKHLLLGNGFSIACIDTIFSYNSLFEETDFESYPEIKKAFEALQTTDFELVIEALEKAALVVPAYTSKFPKTVKKIGTDAQKIKELLIDTIAGRHPKFPAEILDEKYKACRQFLSHFIADGINDGRVYSLNYDLLLYWTLMHEVDSESYELVHNDGFGRDSYFEDGEAHVSDYLSWQGKSDGQNIYYLHGALHLFDSGHQLEKFSWTDTGVPLIEQCRGALNENKFPLFVTEGDHNKKMEKITHSAYLYTAYENFETVMNAGKYKPGNTCLFTYGVSFSDNDTHVFNRIASGRIKHLYVGIFGDPTTRGNKKIIAKAESLKRRRKPEYPLEISYYDSASAKVWG